MRQNPSDLAFRLPLRVIVNSQWISVNFALDTAFPFRKNLTYWYLPNTLKLPLSVRAS